MNKEFIKKLTELVEVNLVNENYGIEDLAREMGMSHSNLHRKLKSSTNQTISQFIREIRLIKAKELLLNEDLTAAEISYRVGFGSPTYFNKCFHEYFGFAPGELRNQEPDNEPEEQPVEVELTPKKPNRRKILIALIICCIFLIPLSIFLINRVPGSKAEKSIAVLPFKYLSNEPEKQYLADGMMDAIHFNLSKIKDIVVTPQTDVEQYRKTDKTISEIGKELGVAYLLEGSFLKNGDQIRLILHLIKTSDDSYLWSHEYNQDLKTIFYIQSKVAETIATELHAMITSEEKQLIMKVPTASLTAYDFYQRGKDELFQFYDDNKNMAALENAQYLFQKALKYDSTYAQAYTGLGRIYWLKHYSKTFYSKNFMDSVLFLANKALGFDHQCAEAYSLRGDYYRTLDKPEQQLKEIDKALKYNPNDLNLYSIRGSLFWEIMEDWVGALTHKHEIVSRIRGKELPANLYALGEMYLDAGFPEKAKKYYQEALTLNGDSGWYFFKLVFLENETANFESAYQLAKKNWKIDNESNPVRYRELSDFCLAAGHDQEAYLLAKKYAEILKESRFVTMLGFKSIGYIFWKSGKTEEAKYYFDQQIKYALELIKLGRVKKGNGIYYDLAGTYAFLGAKGKAYYYLDKYYVKHSYVLWQVNLIKHDPFFNSIREEPQFQKILKDVEGKYQAEHERVRKWLVEQKML